MYFLFLFVFLWKQTVMKLMTQCSEKGFELEVILVLTNIYATIGKFKAMGSWLMQGNPDVFCGNSSFYILVYVFREV